MCMQIGDFATAAQHVAKSVDALASVYGHDGVELGPEYLKLAQLHFHSRQVRWRICAAITTLARMTLALTTLFCVATM